MAKGSTSVTVDKPPGSKTFHATLHFSDGSEEKFDTEKRVKYDAMRKGVAVGVVRARAKGLRRPYGEVIKENKAKRAATTTALVLRRPVALATTNGHTVPLNAKGTPARVTVKRDPHSHRFVATMYLPNGTTEVIETGLKEEKPAHMKGVATWTKRSRELGLVPSRAEAIAAKQAKREAKEAKRMERLGNGFKVPFGRDKPRGHALFQKSVLKPEDLPRLRAFLAVSKALDDIGAPDIPWVFEAALALRA
jgi:hypothetical protein